jgi:hypothetical protein
MLTAQTISLSSRNDQIYPLFARLGLYGNCTSWHLDLRGVKIGHSQLCRADMLSAFSCLLLPIALLQDLQLLAGPGH